MTYYTTLNRLGRRTTLAALPFLVVGTGTVSAHGGGGYNGGMMGGGISGGTMGGAFGGTMGLFGLVWMALLVAVPVFLGYLLLRRESADDDGGPLEVLRERYARGDLSDEEFERRRSVIERSD